MEQTLAEEEAATGEVAAAEVLLVTVVEEAMVVEMLDKMNWGVIALTGIVAWLSYLRKLWWTLVRRRT